MPPFGISLVNEDVMIRKIRLIAKNIFPLDDKELSFNLSESPKSNCPELSIAQTAHQSQQKKRRKIFDKLDYKYRMYSKSPEQRTDSPKVYRGSPLINRINRRYNIVNTVFTIKLEHALKAVNSTVRNNDHSIIKHDNRFGKTSFSGRKTGKNNAIQVVNESRSSKRQSKTKNYISLSTPPK